MAQTVQVIVNQMDTCASEGVARGHRIVMDRPEAKGGSDRGPMGGEVLLMALGGCFMSNLLAAANARNAQVANISLTIAGNLAESPARFDAIRMEISADCDDRALMEKLVSIAEKSCIVANSLKQGIRMSYFLK